LGFPSNFSANLSHSSWARGGKIGCGEKDALRALERLSEEEFSYYDVKTETVWVPTMAGSAFGERMTIADNRVSEPEESKGHGHHKT